MTVKPPKPLNTIPLSYLRGNAVWLAGPRWAACTAETHHIRWHQL